MKKILFLLILFACLNATAQNSYLGLFSKSYVLINGNNDKEKKVIGNIYIIFNRDYCLFHVDGLPTNSFSTRGYMTQLEGEYIHTDFLSEETNTTPDAYYGIMIDEGKKKKVFQVSIRNLTYYVDNAETFSEDGKITGHVYIKNWKEIEQKQKTHDSLSVIWATQNKASKIIKHTNDSLATVRWDSLQAVAQEAALNIGNNLNKTDLKWLNDTVVSKVVGTDYNFSNNFKILIDKNGIITGATVIGGQSGQIDLLINNAVVGQKVEPFEINGKKYPSYGEVYISIPRVVDKPKKKRSIF